MVTEFTTAGGRDLLLDPDNANQRPQPLIGSQLSVEHRLDNQRRAEEEAEEVWNNLDPKAAQRRQNWLLAEPKAALERDAKAAKLRQNRLLLGLLTYRKAIIEGNAEA